MYEPFNSLCTLCRLCVRCAPKKWNTKQTKNHEEHKGDLSHTSCPFKRIVN